MRARLFLVVFVLSTAVPTVGAREHSGSTNRSTISFPCVFYAFSKLSLGDNTRTGSYDSLLAGNRLRYGGEDSGGDIGSRGKIAISGHAVVFGTIFGKVSPDVTPQIAAWNRLGKTKIVRDAQALSRSVCMSSSSDRTKLGDYHGGPALSGGDYEATSINGSISIAKHLTKPIRIFISDESTEQRYAAKLYRTGNLDEAPEWLQIYYLGVRPIELPHNSDVGALIYAPRSTVTMGDNNCQFRGAIIADRIKTIGNVSAVYDRTLKGKMFRPSEPALALTNSGLEIATTKNESRQKNYNRFFRLVEGIYKTKRAIREIHYSQYPAIAKLDLVFGPVTYNQLPDKHRAPLSSNVIASGKEISVQGPSSVFSDTSADGTTKIVIDGLRLTDLALIQLEKGEVERAESILVSALRADPDSETFGLLAECWYLQGKLDDALQACDVALEFDKNSAHAIAISYLAKGKLGQKVVLDEAARLALQSSTSPNSHAERLTGALSCFVLEKPVKSKQLFVEILRKHPKSWRTRSWKEICSHL